MLSIMSTSNVNEPTANLGETHPAINKLTDSISYENASNRLGENQFNLTLF